MATWSALLAGSPVLGNRAAGAGRGGTEALGLPRFNARRCDPTRGLDRISDREVTTGMSARTPIAAPFAGRGGSPSSGRAEPETFPSGAASRPDALATAPPFELE